MVWIANTMADERLACAASGTYDLVILDVMLPVIDGISVLQQLRQKKKTSQ